MNRKYILVMFTFLLLPYIAIADSSMDVIQLGISGLITTPDIILEDIDNDGINSIIIGTSTGLYIFTGSGSLEKYIQTSSFVTNIVVLDDLNADGKKEIVISTRDIYFPNVLCIDGETGSKLWEFSPRTEVYDPYILWTMKQTNVFDMIEIQDINNNGHNDLVLSSGYNVYAVDGKNGEIIWTFEDSDNLWDIVTVNDQNGDGKQEILAGDQNGYVYLLSGSSGEEIWSKYISKSYTVVNPSTNSEVGTVDRSVWDIVPIQIGGEYYAAVSAEDGKVYMIKVRDGEIKWEQEIISYVDALLYNYYEDQPQSTSSSDYNFFNLRIDVIDNNIIASTFPGTRHGREYKGVEGLYSIDAGTGEIKWRNENIDLAYIEKINTIKRSKDYIAIPSGKTGSKDKIKIIDLSDGSTYNTLSINTTIYQIRGNAYFFKAIDKDKFLVASSYGDLFSVNYPDSVVWSYPRINDLVVKKGELTGDSTPDLLVKSKGNADPESPFDEGQARNILVIDGSTREVKWSYELPFDAFSKTGGLFEVKIGPDVNGDGKSDIISYLQYPGDWNQGDEYGEKTRIRVFDGNTGNILTDAPVFSSTYYGMYDTLLKDNSSLDELVREAVISQWNIDAEDDLTSGQIREINSDVDERKSNILNRRNDVKIRKRIHSLDVIEDQSGDGVSDLIIGLDEDVVIFDIKNGNILWNKTRRGDLRENPFTGEVDPNVVHNWSRHDRSRFFAIGDANNDGMDDLVLVDWDSLTFLHSNITGRLDYSVKRKITGNLNKERTVKVGDLNNNGVQDIVFERHIEDSPSVFIVVEGADGETLVEMEKRESGIKLQAADFNGNGFKDSIIFQMWTEEGGPKLEIIDGNTRDSIWNYRGIEETWIVRDILGYQTVMPASEVYDVNGDGVTDVAVARSLAWSPGAEVLIYDVKNNKEIKSIVLEGLAKSRDERHIPGINLELISDVTGDGKKDLAVIVAVGEEHSKSVKMFVVDIEKEEIISDFVSRGRDIIDLGGNNVGIIGSGNFYFLSTDKDLSITSPTGGSTTGSPVRVEWQGETESTATVLVDSKRTLITDEKEAEFEIASGEHKISVYAFDRYGKGVYDTVSVNVEKSSSKVALVTFLLIVLLIMLFLPKTYLQIIKMVKGK
ncbi:MAG: VCBS repeat-containing protein [Candidatus Woesearchaeota archaeon]|nr:MAG: VCBS repeat-containing protein [Candidatus Woesearchaeota archaeon]